MITVTEATNIFSKKNPTLTITKAVDYDENYYLIEAMEHPNKPNYGDPYFGVSKKDGSIFNYSPAGDLMKFTKAMGIEVGDD